MARSTERPRDPHPAREPDPAVAATRDTIDHAKDFGRSAKQDLEQYQRWLAQYAEEQERDRQKHERRLQRFEAEHRRKVRYRSRRRWVRRHAVAFAASLRAISLAVWSALVFAATRIGRAVSTASLWTRDKLYAAASLAGARATKAAIFARVQTGKAWVWLHPRATQAAKRVAQFGTKLLTLLRSLMFTASLRILDMALAALSWLAVRGHDLGRALPVWRETAQRRIYHAANAGYDRGLRLWKSIPAVHVGTRDAASPPCTAFILVEPQRGTDFILVEPPPCTALTLAAPRRCTELILYIAPARNARLPAIVART